MSVNDYVFINYAVGDGSVMQGSIRINKANLQIEMYNQGEWVVISGEGGNASVMTTAQRMAITPSQGQLIYDSDNGTLYVGDGLTVGGVAVGTGGGGTGTVTGIEASVSGNTATITATGSTTSVDIVGTGGVDVKGNTTTGAVELDAKDLSDGTQSVTKDVKEERFIESTYDGHSATNAQPLTILHMSDVHLDSAALGRIVANATALSPNIDQMICTGDMVGGYATQISSWWNPAVLTAIGNHETTRSVGGTDVLDALSMADRDAYYIAPFESNWGVTHTSGTSYYYKDYATQKVRLIVIDVMLYYSSTGAADAEVQTAWIEGLLNDAITNGYHVVIASHSPYRYSLPVQCSFSRYNMENVPDYVGRITQPSSLIDLVANKINSGLHFVGYLVGHYHFDGVWDATGDGTQYAFGVTCACVATTNQWKACSDQYRDTTLDAFNLVTIDTKNTLVKIARGGGANIDCNLRERETITVNYTTGQIIDREIARGASDEMAGFGMEVKSGKLGKKRYIDVEKIDGTTATSVALTAGTSYRITAEDTVTLNVASFPEYTSGLESLVDIVLTGGTVVAGDGLILSDSLTSNKRNICSVKYIDKIAVLNVLTVADLPYIGYVVSVASGTSDGSLYYGVATTTDDTVVFSAELNGQTVSTGGATFNQDKSVIGNGAANTIISGGLRCSGHTATISGLAFSDDMGHNALYTSGGVTVLTDVTITGNTFASNTATLDAGFSQQGGSALVSNCVFSNNCGNMSNGIGGAMHTFGSGNATILDCVFTSNHVPRAGGAYCVNLTGASVAVSGCTFDHNSRTIFSGGDTVNGGGAISFALNGSAVVHDCVFSANYGDKGAGIYIGSAAHVQVTSSLFDANMTNIGAIYASSATVEISGCTFTSAVRSQGQMTAATGGIFTSNTNAAIVNCLFSEDNATVATLHPKGGSSLISGCTVTQNYGSVPVNINGGTATVTNTVASGNLGAYDFQLAVGAVVNFNGGNNINKLVIFSGGTAVVSGTNTLGTIVSSALAGAVTISSGASINLANSIGVGTNGITVLDGGCVVNGATIPAGTYATIISSGGSAVAS